MTAQTDDNYKLSAVVRSAQTIVVFDEASLPAVKQAITEARDDLIRPPQLVVCENYIGAKSINLPQTRTGVRLTP